MNSGKILFPLEPFFIKKTQKKHKKTKNTLEHFYEKLVIHWKFLFPRCFFVVIKIVFINKMNETEIINKIEKSLNKGSRYKTNLEILETLNFSVFRPKEDLDTLLSFNCLICAKTNSGKSVFLNDIVHSIKDRFDAVYVFSLTAHLQKDLFFYVPASNVFNGFSSEKLKKIWDIQKTFSDSFKGNFKKDGPRVLILYDDLIGKKDFYNDELLRSMFVAGRHVNITQFFITQRLTAVPPILRQNTGLCVSFYLDSEKDRETFAEEYLGSKNRQLGLMIFDKITKEPYNALITLNFIPGKKEMSSYIKQYKAKVDIPNFVIKNKDPAYDLLGTPLPTSSVFSFRIKKH